LFNLAYWNPLLFGFATCLLVFGAARRWLTGPEVVLGAVALVMPYLTRGYEMSMSSHGRFAGAVVPTYFVLGRILTSMPATLATMMIAGSAAVLTCWTALYAAGYNFF
jgi:hypothetical protein